MNKEKADKLLRHYLSGFDKKQKNVVLRFAATYHKELRIENQYLKEEIASLNEQIKELESEIIIKNKSVSF
jgi:cell division protein FtsB